MRFVTNGLAKLGKAVSPLKLYRKYEDQFGLTEVRLSHQHIAQTEETFLRAQQKRYNLQTELRGHQETIARIRYQLDRVDRSNLEYVSLITEEHQLIVREREVRREMEAADREERHSFSTFSSALRNGHEKERVRAEAAKYLSMIASLVAAAAGAVVSSLGNHYRMGRLGRMTRKEDGEFREEVRERLEAIEGRVGEVSRRLDSPVVEEGGWGGVVLLANVCALVVRLVV